MQYLADARGACHGQQPPQASSCVAGLSGRSQQRLSTNDLPITRRMLGVDPVGSRRISAAHVECRVGLDGSRRIQKDRLDDQTDDQGASDKESDAKASRTWELTLCAGSLRWPAAPGSAAAACWPGSSTASLIVWSAAARPAPHPSPKRWPTATPSSSRRCHQPRHPGRQREPDPADPRPPSRRAAACLRARPGAPTGRRHRRPSPPGRLGGQTRRGHLPPRRPPPTGRSPARRLGPPDRRRHPCRRRPSG